MKQINLRLTGTSPLLHSCDKLADPLDPVTVSIKEFTSKRKKTEEDHLTIARLQWESLLYWDETIGVVLPTRNIRASIVGGGKFNKLGVKIKQGTVIIDEVSEVNYGKKLTIHQLWEQRYVDRRTVVIGGKSRVMCYRPKFSEWSVKLCLTYDESTLDASQIMQAAENAGKFIGIGGFRPEKGGAFGRFEVERLK